MFASGEVYLSSLMDSLICQSYYNSALITVLRNLIVGDTKKPGNKAKRISAQVADFSHVATSNLYHIKVPSYFIGKRYGKLFDNLTTRRHMVPLGLYRTGRVDLNDYKP